MDITLILISFGFWGKLCFLNLFETGVQKTPAPKRTPIQFELKRQVEKICYHKHTYTHDTLSTAAKEKIYNVDNRRRFGAVAKRFIFDRMNAW